jgi:hypothetical protein
MHYAILFTEYIYVLHQDVNMCHGQVIRCYMWGVQQLLYDHMCHLRGIQVLYHFIFF